MGQVITSDTMSLQEKLAAIAEAIKQLEGLIKPWRLACTLT